MKTGDKWIGKQSGLCLEVQDSDKDSATLLCERRIVNRSTGEIVIEKRKRVVDKKDLATVLLGYEKA